MCFLDLITCRTHKDVMGKLDTDTNSTGMVGIRFWCVIVLISLCQAYGGVSESVKCANADAHG